VYGSVMEMAGHTDSYCHQQVCCAKNFQVKKRPGGC
jgi:hypothetical protein